MRQQINLYLPEFRRQKDLLTTSNMAMFTVALVVILGIVTIKEVWENSRLSSQLAEQQNLRNSIMAEIERLIAEYGTQSEDPALTQRAVVLQGELTNKKLLQQFLDGRNIGSTQGFSEYLADLSRYHLGGLRLTEITLSGGGSQVSLKGEVLSAHLVPQYFQSLRQGGSFSGKEFGSLRIIDEPRGKDEVAVKVFSATTVN